MSQSPDVEAVVIGGGVVGLAVARALTKAGCETVVIERHGRVGTETSSRNSEVIHAGLYYAPGSLRARLCVAGRNAVYRFAEENGVAVRRCGKLVVATEIGDLLQLDKIQLRAHANGVDDVRMLGEHEVRALEPELNCISALYVPSSGVIDSHALLVALEGHVSSRTGRIVTSTEAVGIE